MNISPAALVRVIGDDPPTLLLDEIDTVFGKKASDNHEDLRGILNAGHQRNRPYLRCVGVGANQTVEAFPSFAMAALAGIGALPDTIEDRSVIIRLRRRAAGERVAPFRFRKDNPPLLELGGRLGAWAGGNASILADAEPALPVEDRAADCWEPLAAIADLAGGDWPTRARKAAFALTEESEKAAAGASMALRLLADLRTLFTVWAPDGTQQVIDGQPQFYTAMFTGSILSGLWMLPEAPWASYYGRQFSDRDLASLLSQFGIESREVRIKDEHRKGYRCDDFWDAWTRYACSRDKRDKRDIAGQMGFRNFAPVRDIRDKARQHGPQPLSRSALSRLVADVAATCKVAKPCLTRHVALVADVAAEVAGTGPGLARIPGHSGSCFVISVMEER